MTDNSGVERRDAIDAFAVGLMVALTFTWGFNQVAIKVANSGYNPLFVSALRAAIGAVLMFAWCRYRRIPLLVRDGTFWPGMLVGCIFAVQFALVFTAMDYTTAARGALTLNAMPFWVLIGAHFLLDEKITLPKFCGLMLAFAGVALVFADELSLPNPDALLGDLMSLTAGIMWAATIIVVKRTALSDAPPEKTLVYQLAISAVVVLPFVPLAGPMVRDGNALATWSVVFQALVVVGITYPAWYWLIWRYPAPSLSSFTFLTPVFGVLCGGVLLNEPLSMNIFMALALIAAGLFLVNRPMRRRLPPG